MHNVLDEVIGILARSNDFRPRMAPTAVRLDTRLREDLGLDSLALMSILYELQETHPRLEEEAIGTWLTAADLVRSVEDSDGTGSK